MAHMAFITKPLKVSSSSCHYGDNEIVSDYRCPPFERRANAGFEDFN